MVYRDVTRNSNITLAAKGLYAYLASLCGDSNECYPSVETIVTELGITKDTFYRHINSLVAAGIVTKEQKINNGRFGRTVYKLTHEVEISSFPFPEKSVSDKSISSNSMSTGSESNKNNINNSSINNNNKKNIVCPELEKLPPDPSGIQLPLVDKTEYDVPLSKIDSWKEAYPAVDIQQELRKMIVWLNANPQRKKTRKGIDRFINTWLSREQDKGGMYRSGSRQQEAVKEDYSKVEWEKPSYYQYLGETKPLEDDPFQ